MRLRDFCIAIDGCTAPQRPSGVVFDRVVAVVWVPVRRLLGVLGMVGACVCALLVGVSGALFGMFRDEPCCADVAFPAVCCFGCAWS